MRDAGRRHTGGLDDDLDARIGDQRHRVIVNAVSTLPYGIQASAIYFVGSPRTINVGTNLDPFGLGYNGRWLDATGRRLPVPLFPGFDTLGTLEHIARTGHDHTWFVLTHLLGFEKVRNYDGSWTEWGNSVRVPIVQGTERGSAPTR